MDDLIATLRLKGRVEADDKIIEYAGEWHRLKPGDLYLGKQGDNPPEFLTCRRLEVQKRQTGRTSGKVFSKERRKRLYNLEEVIKVLILDNPNYDPTKKKDSDDATDTRTADATAGDSAGSAGTPSAAPADQGSPGVNRPQPGDPRNRAGKVDYTAPAVRSERVRKPGDTNSPVLQERRVNPEGSSEGD